MRRGAVVQRVSWHLPAAAAGLHPGRRTGHPTGIDVRDTPKPLLEVAGEPFLMHQLRLLAGTVRARMVLCVGYLGERIERADRRRAVRHLRSPTATTARSRSERWGGAPGARRSSASGSSCSTETPICGSITATPRAAWERSGLPAMMTVLRNEGRWDTSNADVRRRARDRVREARPRRRCSWIDYGLGGLTAAAIDARRPRRSAI